MRETGHRHSEDFLGDSSSVGRQGEERETDGGLGANRLTLRYLLVGGFWNET
jgi:hypothetical protein